jgi:UDP-glucuronate decarboxylase
MIVEEDIKNIVKNLGNSGNEYKKKKIVVTGGAGFLGSYICGCLVSLGADVISVDNLCSGLEHYVEHLKKKENFRFIKWDVTKPLEIDEKIDMIFNLASVASPPAYREYGIDIILANIVGTYNMLELARKNNARFFHSSSSEVYGEPEILPTPENYWGKVNTTEIKSSYIESKRCSESLCFAFLNKYGTDIRIARIFNAYGPKLRWDDKFGRVVNIFLHQAVTNDFITIVGEGKQTRSFCYVTDTIEAILRMMVLPNLKGQIINIGTDREISINELVDVINNIVKVKVKHIKRDFKEAYRRCPDISKAKKLLNWEPKVKLEDGLRRTAEWMRE